MKPSHTLAAILICTSLTACQESSNTNTDDHKGHDHGEHADHDHDHDHEHDHDHDHEVRPAGPNGGRVITKFTPTIEFLVQEDRFVKVTTLDSDNKPIKAGNQNITLKGGDRSSPFTLLFDLSDGAYTSLSPLPSGQNLPVILKFNSQISKFNLDLSDCPSCDYREYACTCDH